MAILEDDVKAAIKRLLEERGFSSVKAQMGKRRGYDVEGVDPATSRRLVIECKGEAATGSQHARSWPNVASAVLTTLRESEDASQKNDVAMAFPDTEEYRGRMKILQSFCNRENIKVFWVAEDGAVNQWS